MILGLIIIWIIGYFITLFLCMLIDRLGGLDPEAVYNGYDIDGEYFDMTIALIFLWPFVLIFCIFWIMWKCLRKLMIATIEVIVAIKDTHKKDAGAGL
jgi:hypothetical protein